MLRRAQGFERLGSDRSAAASASSEDFVQLDSMTASADAGAGGVLAGVPFGASGGDMLRQQQRELDLFLCGALDEDGAAALPEAAWQLPSARALAAGTAVDVCDSDDARRGVDKRRGLGKGKGWRRRGARATPAARRDANSASAPFSCAFCFSGCDLCRRQACGPAQCWFE